MSKPFNIHDWQAKQRQLTEERSQESMNNADIRALQTVVGEYSLNKVLNTIAFIADRIGKHDEAYMIQKLASQIQDFESQDENVNEHHAGDYKPGFLKQSVNTFLDKLKKKTKEGKDYKTVEKIMEKYFSAKKKNENVTSTGASFSGTGMGHFGNTTKKKRK